MIFKVLQDRAAESIGGDIRCPWIWKWVLSPWYLRSFFDGICL